MSIRKHFPPEFPEFIKLLKEYGFDYMGRYFKAEALIGDSNSIALIDRYFKDQFSMGIVCRAPHEVRNLFLDLLLQERQYLPFDQAFDVAYEEFLRKHPHL